MSPENAPPSDQLIADFRGYLYGYALRYFREHTLAEDLVQDTLLAAIHAWGGFEGGSSRRTWLVSILRHKMFDHLRRRSHQVETVLQPRSEGEAHLMFFRAHRSDGRWPDDPAPPSWGGSPEVLVEQKQFLAEVERCIARLPARLRKAFLLREIEGRTGAEISNELGVSEANARVLLHRARLLLRDHLQASWFNHVE